MIVVTGASSGLGEAVCEQLVVIDKPGWRPIGLAREDGRHVHYRTDITDRAQVRNALQGRELTGVINCAGVNQLQPFEELNMAEAKRVMDVNVWGAVNVLLEALPALKKSKGIVCNIISDAAHKPMTHSLAYNISKAGAEMMTRQLARELTPQYGIRVFGVSPIKIAGTGMSKYIDNIVPGLRGWTKEEARSYQLKSLMAGEANRDEVASFVVAMCVRAMADIHLSGAVFQYGA